MDRTTLANTCNSWLARIDRISGDARQLVFEPPATDHEVRELERDLGLALPTSLKRALLEVSAHVEFSWFLPKGLRLPGRFRSCFSGSLHWSLEWLLQFQVEKERWIASVFPNPDDPYDRVWHHALAFHAVRNGDYLAISLRPESWEKIVYLSHDDGEGHAYFLARDFMDLLDRWVPLGCPGAEDWQWLPFVQDKESGIDSDGEAAREWLELFRG